ncbi:hypothetical protein T11_4086 [Trichinella zimbabwensis]|uniref:Uncharacterized protein n=1 Tax=Trichinella zimbabwensis TaxID=268475 RepID=A0A0V1HJ20_9BILA|nr:hypothetical protein T11_4086 [Trichinella zimbabwensis]
MVNNSPCQQCRRANLSTVDCATYRTELAWSQSYSNNQVSYATQRYATLVDMNVTDHRKPLPLGLVICSVHYETLTDANTIAGKCRQVRRWHMPWHCCNRFSTQWQQTETEAQPTAKIPK